MHGLFQELHTFNEGHTQIYALKHNLGKLNCKVGTGTLFINGVRKGTTYEMEGTGGHQYFIESYSAEITLNE